MTRSAHDVSALMPVLRERWVFTLATRGPELAAPHVAPLFYALAEPGTFGAGPGLLFTSRPQTMHGRHVGDGPTDVGAAVYLETESVGLIRGVQMRGACVPVARLAAPAPTRAREIYVARHPMAGRLLADPGGGHALYALALTWAKLTDNRVGLGVHPEWEFAHPWLDLGENEG